jgi:hypothetical protein
MDQSPDKQTVRSDRGRKKTPFMEREGLLQCPQEPATGP